MGHLQRREGDTYLHGAWWYRDYDDYLDTVAEYNGPEYRDDIDDDRDDDTDDDE